MNVQIESEKINTQKLVKTIMTKYVNRGPFNTFEEFIEYDNFIFLNNLLKNKNYDEYHNIITEYDIIKSHRKKLTNTM